MKKSCFFISDDVSDQEEFAQALGDTMPDTTCFAIDDTHDALFMIEAENVIPNFIFVELGHDMSTLEFLKVLKQTDQLRQIQVVVHTTDADHEQICELKELALAIYVKPYNYFGLRALLNLYFKNRLMVFSQN